MDEIQGTIQPRAGLALLGRLPSNRSPSQGAFSHRILHHFTATGILPANSNLRKEKEDVI
jgi:hypothetical protein